MKISNSGGNLPSRVVYYGLPGTGKTSMMAYAPRPFFILMRGETGLKTLIDNEIVPPTDHTEEEANSLGKFREYVTWLLNNEHSYKTLVIDALTGLESVIFDHVTDSHFKGSRTSFNAYGAGPAASVDAVQQTFDLLDVLRRRRKMGIILIAHSKTAKFKNPEGLDYNRYAVDCDDKTWGVVNKWADMVLFVKRAIYTKKDGLKVTGSQGGLVLHSLGTAAYDAKNRLNLPEEIELGETPSEAWNSFASAAREARRKAEQQPQPTQSPVQADDSTASAS